MRVVVNATRAVPPSLGDVRDIGLNGIDISQFAKVTILYRLRFIGAHTGDMVPRANAYGGFSGQVPFIFLFQLGPSDFVAIPEIIGLSAKTINVDFPLLNAGAALTCVTTEGCTGAFRAEIVVFLQRA